MEVKINKEIRDYTESIFFGLSLRQLVFSLLAVGAAAGLYFSLRNVLHIEVLGWVCIVGAFPFALLGFIKYNGMNFEQLIVAIVKSVILMPSHLVFHSTNYQKELMAEYIDRKQKEARKEK